MRKPTGDQNWRCLNLHHGININDRFMELIERCMQDPDADDRWNLTDPHTGEVRDTVSAKELWQRILEMRMETGEPYLHFIDTSNRFLPEFQKELGLKIHQSNLCSEIILPTNKDRTAVCCLSSVNLEYYDAWSRDNMFLKDVAEMLDNVLQFFIDNAPEQVARAVFSAKQERSIGIGALGFHAYLQKKNIPWESAVAKGANMRLFRLIRGKLDEANLELGSERGEALTRRAQEEDLVMLCLSLPMLVVVLLWETLHRPLNHIAQMLTGKTRYLEFFYLNKNKHLDVVLKSKVEEDSSLDYDEIWSSIIANDGSVQHLDFLSDNEKDVYKTAMEIDQRWLIELGADRQGFVDQSQSLNLFFRPNTNIKYLHAATIWKKGLKTLYYCRSEKLGKADKVSRRIERQAIKEIDFQSMIDGDNCVACEG